MFNSPRSRRLALLLTLFAAPAFAACSSSHAGEHNFTAENPPLEASSEFLESHEIKDEQGETEVVQGEDQIVRGTVRNVSNVELSSVKAIIEWRSTTDRTLDISIFDIGKLAPGETKPFKAVHQTQYKATDTTQHRLRFRAGDDPDAGALPFRDLAGNQPVREENGLQIKYHDADPGGSHPLPPVTRDDNIRRERNHAGGLHQGETHGGESH